MKPVSLCLPFHYHDWTVFTQNLMKYHSDFNLRYSYLETIDLLVSVVAIHDYFSSVFYHGRRSS